MNSQSSVASSTSADPSADQAEQAESAASNEAVALADGMGAVSAALIALYRLLLADLALAASSIRYSLYFAAMALLAIGLVMLFGAALLVLSLNALGWSWLAAVATTAALSLLAAMACWRRSRRALRYANLAASQRQLDQLIASLGVSR